MASLVLAKSKTDAVKDKNIGFTGDLGHHTIDWRLLLTISSLAIAGIFVGGIISKRVPGEKLKAGFGWFVLAMGIYIIVREILFA